MTDRNTASTRTILFICTRNSARSIMAEGLMNTLGAGRFKAWSAGSLPGGEVNPHALKALQTLRIPEQTYRSKSWEEFAGPDAPPLDFVVTVCDDAAGEVCPVWPGQPMTAHWGVADPAAFQGTEEAMDRAFRDTALILKRRIELMLALPLAALDSMSLQHEMRAIGKQ